MKLSIIIPAYNEEKTILEIINRVKVQRVYNLKKEIIVVDDGSTDKTYELAEKAKGINLLKHRENKGKGFAIRTGLKQATGDLILIQDADLELSPEDYPSLVKPVLENNAKVVYGSRIIGSKKSEKNVFFYNGGKLVTSVANFLYNIKITDEPIGYKLFRSEIIKNLNLQCKRFEFCPEVTAKIAKKGIKIYEVPVKYYPRTSGQGKKLGFKDGIQAVWVLLKYKFMR